MPHILLTYWVASLAATESNPLNEAAKRFQWGGGTATFTQFAVLGAIVLVITLVFWKAARVIALRDGRSYHNPKRLFTDLCRLHELDFPSRKLLWRLARTQQLPQPAQVFVESAWFDAANVPDSLQPFQPQLRDLRKQLFGDSLTPGNPKLK